MSQNAWWISLLGPSWVFKANKAVRCGRSLLSARQRYCCDSPRSSRARQRRVPCPLPRTLALTALVLSEGRGRMRNGTVSTRTPACWASYRRARCLQVQQQNCHLAGPPQTPQESERNMEKHGTLVTRAPEPCAILHPRVK